MGNKNNQATHNCCIFRASFDVRYRGHASEMSWNFARAVLRSKTVGGARWAPHMKVYVYPCTTLSLPEKQGHGYDILLMTYEMALNSKLWMWELLPFLATYETVLLQTMDVGVGALPNYFEQPTSLDFQLRVTQSRIKHRYLSSCWRHRSCIISAHQATETRAYEMPNLLLDQHGAFRLKTF